VTNTLHRFGDAKSFHDDFIVFAMASKGAFKQPNPLPALKRFLQIALEYKPVNLGDPRNGGAFRSSKSMNPMAHWTRDNSPNFQAVIDGLTEVTTCAAVFDNQQAAEQFLARVRQEDFGLSVNISTSVQGRRTAAISRTSRGTASATRSASRARPKTCPTDRWRCCPPCADTEWSATRSPRR